MMPGATELQARKTFVAIPTHIRHCLALTNILILDIQMKANLITK